MNEVSKIPSDDTLLIV